MLFLHVIFKQCAPVLGNELGTCSHGEVREEILDCVLKIWVHSDTLELHFSFSPGPHSCGLQQTHCQGCDVIPIGAHIKEVFAVIGSAVCHGTLPYPEWE